MTTFAQVQLPEIDPDPQARTSGRVLATIGARQAWVALKFLLVMTVLTGVLYPLVVLGIGSLVATHQADGTLVRDRSGAVVGSALIGQQFSGDQWFLGRPSAAGQGYDAMASGGSNLSADSAKMADSVNAARKAIATSDGVRPDQVPADAVTASGSGLDPNISRPTRRSRSAGWRPLGSCRWCRSPSWLPSTQNYPGWVSSDRRASMCSSSTWRCRR